MRIIAKCAVLSVAVCLCLIYLYSVSFALVTVSQDNNSARKSPSQPEPSAKKLFTQNCAKCHGADGRGDTEAGEVLGVPNFTDAKWQESVTDKRLTVSVMHGKGGMPAFQKRLSGEEIASLIAFVRDFKK